MSPVNSVSGSLLQQGAAGLQRSQAGLLSASQRIASASLSTPTQDLVEPLVDLKVEKLLFTASAKVVKTADDVIGTLLDVTA